MGNPLDRKKVLDYLTRSRVPYEELKKAESVNLYLYNAGKNAIVDLLLIDIARGDLDITMENHTGD